MASNDTLIQHCDALPPGILKGFATMPARLDEVHRGGRKYITDNHPPMTMESLRAMIPVPVIDGTWTQEDEDALVTRFEADPYRAYVLSDEAKPLAGNAEFYSMWRALARFRGCFPNKIIGVTTSLQFRAQVDIGGGEMRPDPKWTKGFCKNLRDLAIGSPCGPNMGLLALLIRWTVADRIDDRRKVSLCGHCTGGTGFSRSWQRR